MCHTTRDQWLHKLETLLSETPSEADERAQRLVVSLAGEKERPWILHGAGSLGAQVYEHMLAHSFRIVAVTDCNAARQNTCLQNHRVESPSSALAKWKDEAAVLVTIFNPYHAFLETANYLKTLTNAPIIPLQAYFWRFPDTFLPHFAFDRPSTFLRASDQILECAKSLSDTASVGCYYGQLAFRIRMDFEALSPPDPVNQYFPPDIFGSIIPGPFVDCGAYDGDVLKSLLRRTGPNAPEIIAYEPDPTNFKKLTAWIESIPVTLRPKITCRPVAVGNITGNVSFSASEGTSSRVDTEGSQHVKIVRLDEDLTDSLPGWIKMDLEGHELQALEGAERLYSRSRPVFSICLYHQPSDLWNIPLFIKKRFPDDEFFLRSHGPDGFELVYYALPPGQRRGAKNESHQS